MSKRWKEVLAVLIGNTLIAVILWLSGMHGSFFDLWVVSQCIGFGISTMNGLFYWLMGRLSWKSRSAAIVLGGTVGIGAGMLLGVLPNLHSYADLTLHWRISLLAIVFGIVVCAVFYNLHRLHELKTAQQEASLREMARQKEAAIAHLKLLQAQIEPHFLFNTLANLHSLIGNNDELARTLLERLNDYLRASLKHSRTGAATLADECQMLKALLDIHALRTVGRISYALEIPTDLQAQSFPPMLLQPLVENAISHGLEMKAGPGKVTIRACREGDRLRLSVIDDGVGLGHSQSGHGVGLSNVRERLSALFGPAAELRIRENQPGVISELWIPLAPAP